MVNLYGPNYNDPSFFEKVLNKVPNISNVVIGSDYNCVSDSVKDAQPRRSIQSESATILQNSYLKNFNMLDVWRCLNPSARKFSFYSLVH